MAKKGFLLGMSALTFGLLLAGDDSLGSGYGNSPTDTLIGITFERRNK
ncbi:MAG: hypothetical protein LBT13_01805 [Treponema sp.]|jgi:hypothetical protein|nr:hypothetical protein [Treponema sp.]